MKSVWVTLVLLFSLAANVAAQESGVIAEAFRVVNIRSGPSTAYAVIGQLAPRESAIIVGRNNENSDWLLVQTNGVTGWIAYFVVSVTGDPSSLPVITTDEQSQTREIRPEASSAQLEPAQSDADMVTATTFRRANIRTLPDINAPILLIVQRGETLPVSARSSASNDWLQVETPAGAGWIAYFLVSVEGQLDLLPIGSSDSETTQSASTEIISVNTRFNANLRAEPQVDAEILNTIPFNTVIEANARSSDGNWLRVSYLDEQGWVLIALVSPSGQIDQLGTLE